MVKFSERLESELVPEWKHAFCNYNQLKKDLKNIKVQPQKLSLPASFGSPRTPSFRAPSFRQLGSAARRMSGRLRNAAIQVHIRRPITDDDHDEFYETELLMGHLHGEIENYKVFFARLDGQLNKVNQFYRKKEQEFYEKAEEIKEQLEKLVTMRKMLKEQQEFSVSESSDSEKGLDSSKPDAVMVNVELISIIEQDGSVKDGSVEESIIEQDGSVVKDHGSVEESIVKRRNVNARDLRLVVPQDTPSLLIGTLKQKVLEDISNHSRQPRNKFTKIDRMRFQYAEKTLRDACLELYRGLGFLRSFSSLNMTAFSKILKKYDKNTGRDASVVYMKVVESAYFHSSDKVLKMMDGLERKFTEVFTNGNHKSAMALLRPVRRTASHTVTYFIGLFTGCSIACLVVFFVLLRVKWIRGGTGSDDDSTDKAKDLYLNAIYPLFSILAMVLLHLGLYGWNLYAWQQKRINYAFIFGRSPKAEIKYRELLLIAMGLSTLVAATLLGHFMIYIYVTASLKTAIMPFSILLIFLLLLLCPFNICYRPSRFFVLTSLTHIVFAPFYKVVMADFFLADQLTSQVYMFRNAEYVLCYSIFGRFNEDDIDQCSGDNWRFLTIAYVVSMVPYWWRFAQCMRRWIDERHREHLENAAKYFSALITAGIAMTHHYNKTTAWLAVFIVVSSVVASYQLYWDLYKDWGLLRTNSKNYLLRDDLMLDNKNIYFASMGLNLILRFAWLQSVTRIEFFGIDRHFTDWFFASLEVVRRVHWNFYRLENEHLNNVGKFRATKAIPLPFASDDDED